MLLAVSLHSPDLPDWYCNFVVFVLDREFAAVETDLVTFSFFRIYRRHKANIVEVLDLETPSPFANHMYPPTLIVVDYYWLYCDVDAQKCSGISLMMDTFRFFIVVFFFDLFDFFRWIFSSNLLFCCNEILSELGKWTCLFERFNLNDK